MAAFVALLERPNAATCILQDFTPVEDVLRFRIVCKAAVSDVEPYFLAIAYAKTRVCVGGLPLTLGDWQRVWNECARSVQSAGVDPSVWGHAIEWTEKQGGDDPMMDSLGWSLTDWIAYNVDLITRELDPKTAVPLIDQMIAAHMASDSSSDFTASSSQAHDAMESQSTAWILSLTGSCVRDADPLHWYVAVEVDALVILRSGQFAVVSGKSKDPDMWQCAVVYEFSRSRIRIEKTLAAAVSGASWIVDAGGRLTISHALGDMEPIQRVELIHGAKQFSPRNKVLRRYAADGIAYQHSEFVDWYVTQHLQQSWRRDDFGFMRALGKYRIDILEQRWEEAAPCNPEGDRFSHMVRSRRQKPISSETIGSPSADNLLHVVSSPSTDIQKIEQAEPLAQIGMQQIEGTSGKEVIQEIQHPDPPEIISEQEAAEFSAIQQADFIQRIACVSTSVDTGHPADSRNLDYIIIVAALNRNTKKIREELSEGVSLRRIRKDLEGEGIAWKLPSGGFIFVRPTLYRSTMLKLEAEEMVLTASHIVFDQSLEYILEEALQKCGGVLKSSRSSVSVRTVWNEVATSKGESGNASTGGAYYSEALDESEVVKVELKVVRTFICAVTVDGTESVFTKSTTDMHGFNPRHFHHSRPFS